MTFKRKPTNDEMSIVITPEGTYEVVGSKNHYFNRYTFYSEVTLMLRPLERR